MEENFEAKFYDVVIDAKSFEDLGDLGWNVQVSKAAQEPLDGENKKQFIEELQKPIKSSKRIKDPQEKEKKLKEIEEKVYTKYDQWKNQDRPIIGVIGQGNRGKSFLLSKVADFELPAGHNIVTKGISVKYIDFSDIQRFILLDSAGSSTPLVETTNFSLDMDLSPEEARKKVNAICRDKTQSEIFLQNFVIKHSNIIIAVVGQMTYSEQKMLNRIKREQNKELFVVHNLMNFETVDQVDNYIEETLKRLISSELKEQTFVDFESAKENKSSDNTNANTKYYTENIKLNNKDKTITHIILARDNCEETKKYYNEPGIKFLKHKLAADTQGTKFDVIHKAMEYLANTSQVFMEKPLVGPPKPKKGKKSKEEKKENEEDKEEEQQNIFYEEVKNQETNEVKGNKIIVKGTEIQLKKILITEIGESSYLGSGYEPRVSVMIKQIKDNQQLVIDLEITGEKPTIKLTFRHDGENILFHCKGEKKLRDVPSSSVLSSQYKMKNEKIDFRFKITLDKYTIQKESQKIDYFIKKNEYNGITRITYDIEEEEEETEELEL